MCFSCHLFALSSTGEPQDEQTHRRTHGASQLAKHQNHDQWQKNLFQRYEASDETVASEL